MSWIDLEIYAWLTCQYKSCADDMTILLLPPLVFTVMSILSAEADDSEEMEFNGAAILIRSCECERRLLSR